MKGKTLFRGRGEKEDFYTETQSSFSNFFFLFHFDKDNNEKQTDELV